MNHIDQIPYKQFKKLFVAEQYQYFQDNGYKIFVTYNSIGELNLFKYISEKNFYSIENENFLQDKDFKFLTLNEYIRLQTENENDFLYHIKPYSHNDFIDSLENNSIDKLHNNFVDNFFKNHPESRGYILKDLPKLLDKHLKYIYQDFLDQFSNNKEELIGLIHSFPINTWHYKSLPLEHIHDYLTHKGLTKDEFNEFLLTFLHNRKQQLQIYEYSVRDYLINYFKNDEEKLISFFDILPVLKADFIEPEIDIFLQKEKFSDTLIIGIKKLKESFLIGKWDYMNYKEALFSFVFAIQKHYNLEDCKIEQNNSSIAYYSISFFHNNENITKKDIEKLIINYFITLRDNSEYITIEDCEHNWLLNNTLENKIGQKSIKQNKKKI